MWLGAWNTPTWFGFGYPIDHGSYKSYVLREPETGSYQLWVPNKWTHLCFGYEKEASFLRMVKVPMISNGYKMNE